MSEIPAREPDYRFTLANERTFLAWQRTSLGLLAASVALMHFQPFAPVFSRAVATTLGVLAITTAAGGLTRWRSNDRAIRADRPLPRPRLATVTAVAMSGVAASIVLVAAVS
ncbi:putative membrane protein [Nocardia caishijiensis]|uniref:Membrane protein n=2 Tax=Nocardia caishijiensis TaxID=184756 RepID=A0ABQ6YHF1_9NOCA|nr:putative membrane protein [Nocardia caishijiensis]